MAELKTKRNNQSVKGFLNGIPDERNRRDACAILALMQQFTKAEPQMWGSSSVGFGTYHYRYASGREGDWPIIGFSPRKQSLTLYIMAGFEGYGELLGRLGKHKTAKACLYINRLEDVHLPTLKALIRQSVQHMVRKAK